MPDDAHGAAPRLLTAGIALLVIAWVFATPPGASPDEPEHFVRAIGVARGELRNDPLPADVITRLEEATDGTIAEMGPEQREASRSQAGLVSVPRRLVPPRSIMCSVFAPAIPASCDADPAPRGEDLVRTPTNVAGYPPFLYGIGGFAALGAPDARAGILAGRLVWAAIAIAFVAAAISLSWGRRAGSWAIVAPMLALTPVALFTGAMFSPSALEIAAGALFVAAVVHLRRAHDVQARRAAVLALVVIALARPFGPVLVGLLVAAGAIVLGRKRIATLYRGQRGLALLAAGLVLASMLANGVWTLLANEGLPLRLADVPGAVLDTFLRADRILFQGIGVFGWLDAPMPRWAYYAWGYVLAVVLLSALAVAGRAMRVRIAATAALGLLSIAVLAAATASAGFGLQTRWVMPVLMFLPWLAAEALADRRAPGAGIAALAVGSAAVHALAFLSAGRRHAVGSGGPAWFLTDPSWSPPGGWWTWAGTAAVGAVLVAVSGILAARQTEPRP